MGADGLGRYSLGVGDRFAHEGEAQMAAFVAATSSVKKSHGSRNRATVSAVM